MTNEFWLTTRVLGRVYIGQIIFNRDKIEKEKKKHNIFKRKVLKKINKDDNYIAHIFLFIVVSIISK